MLLARTIYAILLTGALLPVALGAWAPAILLGWGLVATGLGLGLARQTTRRAATRSLAALALLVLITVVGAGITFGRTGTGAGGYAWDDIAMAAALTTLWLPTGIYLAHGTRDTPQRLATIGIFALSAWFLLYNVLLVTESGILGFQTRMTEAHIVLFLGGALLVTGVIVARIVKPRADLPFAGA